VEIGNTAFNKSYDGNIRELIYVLGMQHNVICECINKKMRREQVNVEDFLKEFVNDITPGDKVTAQNLSTLCSAIYELNKDNLQALHGMLCFQFDFKAWRILVDRTRRAKGYLRHYGTSDSVNPLV
jgi:hypothetical protein